MNTPRNAVYPLFATPLMVVAERYEFSEAEHSFIDGLELKDNNANSMSVDDQILDRAELSPLRTFIESQLASYAERLLHIPNTVYITQSWLNVAGTGQYHPKHKHPNSVVSGVIFLDDNSDKDLPTIRFHRSWEPFPLEFAYTDLNEVNASCQQFDPEQGQLMLFPSMLEHDVGVNETERPRRSISFNTFVKGSVGGKEQLTRVDLNQS